MALWRTVPVPDLTGVAPPGSQGQAASGRVAGWGYRARTLGWACLLALAACAPNVATQAPPAQAPVATAPEPEPEPEAARGPGDGRVRVALLLPLSGSSAGIGQAMLDAAQIALFDLADANFVLMPHDTLGTPEGAAAAAEAALADGAGLILGPLFARSVAAVKPHAQAAGVSVLAFSNDLTVGGDGVYVMGFVPHDQVRRVVGYARAQGLARFASLAPSTPYGDAVVDSLYETAQQTGAAVVEVARYDPNASDISDIVRHLARYDDRRAALEAQRQQLSQRTDEASRRALARLQGLETFGEVGFDAILLAEGGTRLRSIAPLLPFYDIDPTQVQVLGTGLWDEPGLGQEPALVGAWFAAPAPEARAGFEQRFEALYGRRPPRLATLAYDATALAAVLAREPEGPAFDGASLTNPSGFAGIDGIFRLHANGMVERGLAVVEVTRDGSRVIDPAPTTFEEVLF